MNKREKILVFASVAAVLWGVIVSLARKSPVDQGTFAPQEDVQQFVVTVTDKLKSSAGDSLKGYNLTDVFGKTYGNPFLGKGLSSNKTTEDLVYSGYVRSGRRILALINKMEYQVGDRIEGTGMTVKNIDPFRVVLLENSKKKRILSLEGGGK